MDPLKQLMHQRLIANVISDKLKTHENVLFEESWCSVERTLRFTTVFFRQIFSFTQNGKGKWKTGDFVMYEIENGVDSFVVNCVLAVKGMNYETLLVANKIKKAAGTAQTGQEVILKSWDFSDVADDSALFAALDDFLSGSLPDFEKNIQKALNEPEVKVGESTADYGLDDDLIEEGGQTLVKLTRYERSRKARAKCLAYYGTACKVCGYDFAKMFGPEFADKIEVHHIVPLSEIGENYIVDPLKDLIPVCPNCHLALHSKKNGVYTVEELKQLRTKGK